MGPGFTKGGMNDHCQCNARGALAWQRGPGMDEPPAGGPIPERIASMASQRRWAQASAQLQIWEPSSIFKDRAGALGKGTASSLGN